MNEWKKFKNRKKRKNERNRKIKKKRKHIQRKCENDKLVKRDEKMQK